MPLTATPSLTCVSSAEEIGRLVPALEALWRIAGATPFQHPGWWLPWISAFHVDDPRVLVAWQEDRLVGALPLYRRIEGGEPVLRVMGCGNTDYLDAVIADDGEATCDAFAALIDRDDARLDLLDLPPGAALESILARSRRPITWGPCARCRVVALPGDVSEWRASLPRGLSRNLQRYGDRLAATGPTIIVRVEGPDRQGSIDAFFDLHAARWHRRGEGGVLADPAVAQFQRTAIPWLHRAGVGRLYVMRHRGAPIAAQYVLVVGPRPFSYLSGFAPAFSRFSPGSLLMAHVIEEPIREGCRTFDLLRGEERYKSLWANSMIETRQASVCPIEPSGHA